MSRKIMYSHPNGVLANRTSQSLSTSSPKVKVYEWHRREKKKGNWKKKKKRWKSIRSSARSESFIFICVSSLEDLYIMDRMWYQGNRGQKYLLSQTGESCLCFEWPQELVMWIIRFLRELWGRWNAMLFFRFKLRKYKGLKLKYFGKKRHLCFHL